ncbi:Holliday junction resolvase RuvX [Crocinitomix algicola]|uniref:Holliday junction resolvase RuvX n=1 Tax=Crocinitomix algicola TaxID=1740263 RepID=UPI000836D27E|nr:Holliday junction resolvase RuvX [Crocinitomix algicola]
MSQFLALDYGEKRTGIAVTDDSKIIATGLTTVDTKDLFKFLGEYFQKNDVTDIVLGEPKRLNGEATHSSSAIAKLKVKLHETFGKPVHLIDERFTSKMAFQSMIDSGVSKKKRKNKGLIDEISATIILQSFMETQRF